MQIANGMVILSPEHHQFKRDVTPAEVLILHKMHFQYSNGSPLGEFYIQPGEALTIDSPGRAAEDAYLDHMRREVPAKPAVPPKTHKRTQQEEIARLKKKYTGNITVDGAAKPAFEATFGSSVGVRLPETFEDIESIVGKHFYQDVEQAVHSDDKARALELARSDRPELVRLATKLELTIHHTDSKDFIIAAIINAENKLRLADLAGGDGSGAEGDGLEQKTREELLAIAKELPIEIKGNPGVPKLIALIRGARTAGGEGSGAE